jgi:uncharacterized membrane-anchored protein YitT (DUF2179 family)
VVEKKIVVREYVITTIGLVITAIGLVIFLIPNGIAAGGVSGLAMIFSKFTGFPVGIWMYVLNAILFLLAFLTIGFDFSAKTIYSTFVLNFLVDFFDRIVPIWRYHPPYVDHIDLILAVFFGDILTAVGMALAFSQNSSTGGTDIIARIINRYFGSSIGVTLLVVDFSISIFSMTAFGIEKAMYAILAVIINGLMIDFTLRGIEQSSKVLIFSEKIDEIKDFILNKLERGATLVPAVGAYSERERTMILTVIRRRELMELVHFIKEVDPKAFVVIGEVRQVLGEGFKRIEKAL